MPDKQNRMLTRFQSLSDLDKIPRSESRYQDSNETKYRERKWLNDYQFEIYRSAMYGLDGYSPRQLHRMSIQQKRKISKFHAKVQRVLNTWKQQLVNQLFEHICSIQLKKFPKNPFKTVFEETRMGVSGFGQCTDETFKCTLTFEQLKITRGQIIQKLITEGVLPSNFYQLNKKL